MIVSYQWLSEYLPESIPVEELSRILTSIGLEVEGTEPAETIKGSLKGLVIGEVLTCEKHPNADKLSVTTVDTGAGEPLNIVCGAPNVAAGQRVVIAPVGTMVHPLEGEPFLIKKAKIRGSESAGMICAEDEIGLGNSHAGIIILPADAPVGMLAKDYYNIPDADTMIHIGLTPNRSDAMSHIGTARDVCAYLTHHNGRPYTVKYPDFQLSAKGDKEVSVNVDIKIPDAAPRYTGISIADVKVGPSPEWLKQRLQAIEIRSINNIVDITNYVLHEYGQPLHAFDADKIAGKNIHVQFLPEGSPFMALDGKERKLQAEDIMICDDNGPIAMGGVFGGQDSGVSEQTTSIFLESAYFTPSYIRKTSLHHGLRTDAATHFEKGVDINNVIPALKRAAALIVDLAGGTVALDITDIYPDPVKRVEVYTTYQYIAQISGKKYTNEQIKDVLNALNFEIKHEDENGLTVIVPSSKTDVLQPADIVEEILRIDGLDNVVIPSRLNISLTKAFENDRQLRERAADDLCGMGFMEIVTNSITNSKYYPDNTTMVRLLNSLSSELDVMRPSMLESGLEVIQYNNNRKNKDLFLFEIGKIYAKEGEKYVETPQLAMWLTGNVTDAGWAQQSRPTNIFYLKSIIRNLFVKNGINNTALAYEQGQDGDTLVWKWKNKVLCTATQVAAVKLNEFDVKQDVYFAVIEWDVWVSAARTNKVIYSEVTKFPAVQRDLSLVLDNTVKYGDVQKTTDQLKLASLQSFDLFDIFESEKLGAGKKSYSLSYTFQLQDRTLTDVEIEQMMKQLIEAYKTKLQAQIRE